MSDKTVIRPTIGRPMWFYKYSASGGHKGPLAGHVAKVYSSFLVNLRVIDEDGGAHPETRVPVVQEGYAPPNADYCCRMPYQLGRAKENEDVLAQRSS